MAGARITKGAGVTPTESLVSAALLEVNVTDAAGKVITLKKPNALAQYRIVKVVGGETAANQTLMMMYMPLLYVAAIDGDPVGFPTSERQLEALITRLDDPGLAAVMQGVEANWGGDAQKALEADVKN